MKKEKKLGEEEELNEEYHVVREDKDGNIIIEPWMEQLADRLEKEAREVVKSSRFKHKNNLQR